MMKLEGKTKNLHNLKGFDFSSDELIELDSIIKSKKFEVKKEIDIVYPSDHVQKLRYFINCLRLIEHVAYHVTNAKDNNKTKIHGVLQKKVKEILIKYNDLYVDAELLNEKYSRDAHYAKHRVKRRITELLIQNHEEINNVMDFIYHTGKNLIQVNPDETLGYT